MPNALAYLALFLAIPAGVAVFFMLRPALATIVVFLGAFLFLPEQVELDLPGLPGLGKEEVAAVACLIGALLRARRRLFTARPFRGPDIFVVLLIVGAMATAMTNREPLRFGPVVLPALSTWEGMSMAMGDILLYWIPFFLGRALIVTARDLRALLASLVWASVAYTPFIFVELVMSPQLHNWVYGFHQHDFIQTMRGGGFRPMVFMHHGLALAMFLVWGVVASATLSQARKPIFGLPAVVPGAYVFGFLIAAKSLGAAVYAVVFTPLVRFLRAKALVRIASLLALCVFAYPITRAVDVFPAETLVSVATAASGDRAASLEYRFHMEHILAERATERALFGWGRFRRNMVLDPDTGKELSVSDGYWIVLYGIRGAWGLACFFALLLVPIFRLRRRLRRVRAPDERAMLAGLAMIVSIAAVDLLPNALFNTLPLFLAGALWGATRALSRIDRTGEESVVVSAPGAAPVVARPVPRATEPTFDGNGGRR